MHNIYRFSDFIMKFHSILNYLAGSVVQASWSDCNKKNIRDAVVIEKNADIEHRKWP